MYLDQVRGMFPLDFYCISIIDDSQNDLCDISSQHKVAKKIISFFLFGKLQVTLVLLKKLIKSMPFNEFQLPAISGSDKDFS